MTRDEQAREHLQRAHRLLFGDEDAKQADNARLASDVARGVEALLNDAKRDYVLNALLQLRWLVEHHMKGSRKHDARVLLDNLQGVLRQEARDP